MSEAAESEMEWAETWLTSVVSGASTMSQRTRRSVERHVGSLEEIKRLAEARGVHLLLIEDDQGTELIAASMKPFTVLC